MIITMTNATSVCDNRYKISRKPPPLRTGIMYAAKHDSLSYRTSFSHFMSDGRKGSALIGSHTWRLFLLRLCALKPGRCWQSTYLPHVFHI